MTDQSSTGRDSAIDASQLPRIQPLTYEEADEPTRVLFDKLKAISRSNVAYKSGVRQADMGGTMMHNPDLYELHHPFTQYLMKSPSLPERHREIAILRTAWLCGSDVQWVNHTRIGLTFGLTQDDVDRIPAGADAPGWADEEATLLRAVDELQSSCRVGDATWSSLAAQYSKRQIIEFLVLVGNYRTLSYVQCSVGMRPPTGTSPNIPGNRFLFPE